MPQTRRIGVTMRVVRSGYGETRDALARDWPLLFERLGRLGGYAPDWLMLPNTGEECVELARRQGVRGLLLTAATISAPRLTGTRRKRRCSAGPDRKACRCWASAGGRKCWPVRRACDSPLSCRSGMWRHGMPSSGRRRMPPRPGCRLSRAGGRSTPITPGAGGRRVARLPLASGHLSRGRQRGGLCPYRSAVAGRPLAS